MIGVLVDVCQSIIILAHQSPGSSLPYFGIFHGKKGRNLMALDTVFLINNLFLGKNYPNAGPRLIIEIVHGEIIEIIKPSSDFR